MAEANKKQQPVITFASHSMLNEGESSRKGRPIFDDLEVCEIRYPGDLKCWAVFPAHEAEPNATRENGHIITYAQVHNEQYLKFKNGLQQTVTGTPLSEAPFLSEGKRRELRALNIHTIEQLAGLDGSNLKTLGIGGREWKNQAQAFLDAAAGTADVTGMAAQIAQLQETVRTLMASQAQPAPAAPPEAEGNEGEKAIEDCSDDELRQFIVASGGNKPPANTGRARLIAIATELVKKEDAAA